jgi:hypothetical protein
MGESISRQLSTEFTSINLAGYTDSKLSALLRAGKGGEVCAWTAGQLGEVGRSSACKCTAC